MPADIVAITTEIVTAHIANNSVQSDQLPNLIRNVYSALSTLGSEPAEVAVPSDAPHPAVTVRKSLANPSRIISMIDGQPYASLKRHLGKHGYTPESYRAAFGLKPDYPMVAPDYVERRREIAKKIGLGRKPDVGRTKPPEAEPEDQPTLPIVAPAQPEAAVTQKRKTRKKAEAAETPEQQNEPSTGQPDDLAPEQSRGGE